MGNDFFPIGIHDNYAAFFESERLHGHLVNCFPLRIPGDLDLYLKLGSLEDDTTFRKVLGGSELSFLVRSALSSPLFLPLFSFTNSWSCHRLIVCSLFDRVFGNGST